MGARKHSADRSGLSTGISYLLAGLETGVLGSLGMLLWLMLGSVWYHRSAWIVPNLFATSFAGAGAYFNHFARTSLGGAALLIVLYGALGMVWGLLSRLVAPHTNPTLLIVSVVYALAVYFLLFDFVWPRANPFIVLYTPDRQMIAGHVLWGLFLSPTSRLARDYTGDQEVSKAELIL